MAVKTGRQTLDFSPASSFEEGREIERSKLGLNLLLMGICLLCALALGLLLSFTLNRRVVPHLENIRQTRLEHNVLLARKDLERQAALLQAAVEGEVYLLDAVQDYLKTCVRNAGPLKAMPEPGRVFNDEYLRKSDFSGVVVSVGGVDIFARGKTSPGAPYQALPPELLLELREAGFMRTLLGVDRPRLGAAPGAAGEAAGREYLRSISGYALLGGRPVCLASAPIFASEADGSRSFQGRLTLWRHLKESDLEELALYTGMLFRINQSGGFGPLLAYGGAEPPQAGAATAHSPAEPGPIGPPAPEELDPEGPSARPEGGIAAINLRIPVQGVEGLPAIQVSAVMDLKSEYFSEPTRAFVFKTSLVLPLLFALLFYLILSRFFLAPVQGLYDFIVHLRRTGIRNTTRPPGREKLYRDLFRFINELVDGDYDESRRNALIQQSNQGRRRFLSNLAKELEGPLGVLLQGRAAQSAIGAHEPGSGKDAERSGELDCAEARLGSILAQIRDYAWVNSDEASLEEYPFTLDGVLEEVAGRFHTAAREKGLNFIYDVPPDVPQKLVGDRRRFQQILEFLLDNAFKYTDSGEIFLGCMVEEKMPSGIRLRFVIRDSGLGMSPEDLAKISSESLFARGEAAGRNYGLGLGLAVTRGLVRLMGGDLALRSVQDRGTSANFVLSFSPYSESPGLAGAPQSAALAFPDAGAGSEALRDTHILVVDGSQAGRLALFDMLKGWSGFIDTAESADEALALFRRAQDEEQPHRLILISQELPEGALDLVASLREASRSWEGVLCILVGMNFAECASQMSAYGINGFIFKPVTVTRLLESIIKTAEDVGCRLGQEADNAALLAKPDLSGYRLLLVEDNPINEQMALDLLEDLGAEISVARTGKEAVDLVLGGPARPFDLILMDIQMPIMDGVTATRLIREKEGAPSVPSVPAVPILAMTAHVRREEVEKYLQAGMNGHIPKPIDIKTLYKTLRQVLPASAGQDAARPGQAESEDELRAREKWCDLEAGSDTGVTWIEPPFVKPARPLESGAEASGKGTADLPLKTKTEENMSNMTPQQPGLPELPGFDSAAALKLLNNNEKLYGNVLKRFLKQYAAEYEGYARRFSQVDSSAESLADLQREAHTLKGLGGTIGHPGLHESALAFEQALKEGGRPQAELQSLGTALADTLGLVLDVLKAGFPDALN